MPIILLHALTAARYAVLALHFWRTRWGANGTTELAGWERAAIVAPLAYHSVLIHAELLAGPELRFGFGHALSVMMWLGVLIYWVESLYFKLEGMQALGRTASDPLVRRRYREPGRVQDDRQRYRIRWAIRGMHLPVFQAASCR